jgi:enoyl-CoA hydratase/carnithine racemase
MRGFFLVHKVAMELMLLGESIDTARAWQVGFVNRVVPVGQQTAAANREIDTVAPICAKGFRLSGRSAGPCFGASKCQRGRSDLARFDALDKKPPRGYMDARAGRVPIGTICGRACSLNVCKD